MFEVGPSVLLRPATQRQVLAALLSRQVYECTSEVYRFISAAVDLFDRFISWDL